MLAEPSSPRLVAAGEVAAGRTEALLVEQNRVLELIATGRPLAECLHVLTDMVARLRPDARASVALADADRNAIGDVHAAQMPASFAAALRGAPIGEQAHGTCSAAMHAGESVTCADIANSTRWSASWRAACLGHGMRACHSTPVFGPGGNAVASFMLCFGEPREPDAWELRLAASGAHLASIVIERDRAAQALRESEVRLGDELADTRLLQAISARLVREQPLEALYASILDAAAHIMRSPFASLQRLDAERGELSLLAHRGFGDQAATFWSRVRADSHTTCGRALQRGERIVVPDIERCEFVAGSADHDVLRQQGIGAVQSTPLVASSGRTVGMLSTHWHNPHQPSERDWRLFDVLERQAADLIERKDIEAEMRASEARLRELAEAMPQIVYVMDADGKVGFINRQWREYTGEAGASADQMKALIHPDDRRRVVESWCAAVGDGTLHTTEFRLRRADGEYRWFLARSTPVRDAEGRIAHWYGTSTNIDFQKRYAEALKRAHDQLQLADRRKDEFLATLAHELRNPLAPLRNSVHLLQMSKSPEVAGKVHAMMQRQIDHLVRLVDDLLEMSRITSGKIELQRAPVALGSVLQTAVEASRPLLEAAGHDLALDLRIDDVRIDADAVRMAQVFSNLLNNAAKYTEPGGRIRLSARQEDGEAVISVQDNGVGIAPELLPRVFELFVQAEGAGARAQGGLGIGLSLVQSLLALHGGSVEAKSEGLGRGSEFVVRLPVAAAPVDGAAPAPQPAAPSRHLPLVRVLVCDDNRDAADSLASLLEFLGARATVVYDGPAALAAARAERPRLVLLDIGMPAMDGYAVARELRALPEGRALTLVALTGWGQQRDRERTRAAGFDRHLVKPVELQALQALLASALEAGEKQLEGTP